MKKAGSSPQDFDNLFTQIASTQKWEQLEQFRNLSTLDIMSQKERTVLANLFYQKGKHLSLDRKCSVQLKDALSSFETALKIDPSIGCAWTEKADVLMDLAEILEDPSLYNEACEMFSYAQKVYSAQGQAIALEKLYRWGVCYYQMGKVSEEPLDFKCAVEKFREAYERGYDNPEFFFDYATALAELGAIIGRIEFILESLEHFKKCLNEQGGNSKAWLKLASVCKLLYLLTGDQEYYILSDQGFFEAARSDANSTILWTSWGQLLVHEGKLLRDGELLAASLEKFEKADSLSPNNPLVLSSWAEALMHLGASEERLDLLREAKEKITAAHEINPQVPDIYCLHGHCLIHLGRYFGDDKHLLEAVKQFQAGLEINKNIPVLWHGLGTAHYILGEICQDFVHFEKAAKCCSEAINLGEETNAQYWNDWGVALMKIGEMTQDLRHMVSASEKFEKAIALYNNVRHALPDAEWFYNYGCCLDYLGDFYSNPQYYEKAIHIFVKLLDQNPSLTHVRYNLALALFHLGESTSEAEFLDRAIEHFEILHNDDAEDEVLCNDFGLCYLTLGDLLADSILPQKSEGPFARSEQLFLQAIALGSQIAYYHLGCLHALRGNFSEAMSFMDKAKECDALPPIDDLLRDEWLEGLRQTPSFREFLSQLSTQFD